MVDSSDSPPVHGRGSLLSRESDRTECERRRLAGHPAARGETPAAFGRRCIPPPPQRGCRVGGPGAGCVAPRSNTPGIAPHRAQDARWGPRLALVAPFRRGPHGADCAPWGGGGRIAALGATLDFHHGLLGVGWRRFGLRIGGLE